MKDVRPLVRIQHGSHLYGTSTPTSDLDYKSVHLPSGRGILLGKPEEVIDTTIKLSAGPKNAAGDVDDQSYSLAKWLKMLYSGDTVGTEILFAPPDMIVEMDPLWPEVQERAKGLLNKQVKGFVSYCQRQAAKYGVKGSRMAACKDVVDLLAAKMDELGTSAKLFEIEGDLTLFCSVHEFSEIVPIKQQSGDDLPHLEVVDRKIPFTNTVKQAHDIYAKVYDNYGERARAAMDNKGIDWKAMSHAVRVAGQALELLRNGTITFPRVEAPLLLQIKKGEVPFNDVGAMLEALVDDLDAASAESSLPRKPDYMLVDRLVLDYYGPQVSDEAKLREGMSRIANLGSCAHGKTPQHKLFQQAIDIAMPFV